VTDGVRLYLCDGGAITLPLAALFAGTGEPGELMTVPVMWYVLTHPRGTVIIDGGFAPECAVDAAAHWGPNAPTVTMAPEQAVVPQLERLGIDLASVRWVVQTHLHIDHTGALAVIDRFPQAEVLVTRTEYDWGHDPDSKANSYCWADYVKPGIRWVTLEEHEDGYDLFGDGTLRCWRTPGHTPGHQSVEIHLPSGAAFLLAIDAANSADHLNERAFPAFMASATDTQRSVRKLRRLAWRSQAEVIYGHDRMQWPTLRHPPESYN
jgi:glyoxylase-like metal-dependent hydrolase (beta-lactamase superfamily II)